MNKKVNELRSIALQPIYERSKYKRFLTNQEFNENIGKIFIINQLANIIDAKIEH